MLSKEEISKLKINVFNQCDDETIRLVAEMLNHTEQLESDKQKLIEKLNEEIKEYKEKSGGNTYHIQSMINAEIRKLEWILSILKEENYK